MTEFDIIKQYFSHQRLNRQDVTLGMGDDAALVSLLPGQELAITTDTLVSGIHFPLHTTAFDIGYKSLAVNLSDLAAMGATPAWMTLALTIPTLDEEWIKGFSAGLFTLANRHAIQLIGGDLTHGPLSITIQALGHVPAHQAIRRGGAKPGDHIYITGTLGDAGYALSSNNADPYLLERLNRPSPRVAEGELLRNLASAAIDISDGLGADLGHILTDSKVGALVYVDQLPFSTALSSAVPVEEAIALALTAGDDYELCFTLSSDKEKELKGSCGYTCIGKITGENGLILQYQNGNTYHGSINGYRHF